MLEQYAVPLENWPQPDAGAPSPEVFANDTGSFFVSYGTNAGKVAVIHFPLCSIFTFGSPNDEALAGHPLYGNGLEFYSVHKVENSDWIALLERRNSVHSRHNPNRFLEDKKHYIFTFHDSTLECVVTEGQFWKPEIIEFDSDSDAKDYLRKKRKD